MMNYFRDGFSLIEVLIYIAVFMLVSTAAIGFLVSLDDLIDEYRVETALYRSSTKTLEQVQLSLRQADTLDLLNAATSTSDGVLAVTGSSSDTQIAKVGDELQLSIDGVLVGDLLQDEVVATDFTVFHYPMSIGEVVRVRMGLTATVGSTTKSIQLYTGSVLRDSI